MRPATMGLTSNCASAAQTTTCAHSLSCCLGGHRSSSRTTFFPSRTRCRRFTKVWPSPPSLRHGEEEVWRALVGRVSVKECDHQSLSAMRRRSVTDGSIEIGMWVGAPKGWIIPQLTLTRSHHGNAYGRSTYMQIGAPRMSAVERVE